MSTLADSLINTHPRVRRDIEKAHQFFMQKKGVRAVWLFGSASKNRMLDWRSDLDFAVSGLLPGEEYETWAQLDEILVHPVDLVRLEDANPLLKKEILEGYPHLTREDIQACLKYARKVSDSHSTVMAG